MAKNYTQSQLHNAAKTASEITEQSPIVRSCYTVMMLAQQIFSVANSALSNNITHDWECQDPELVIHQLQNAANAFAKRNMTSGEFTIASLRDNALNQILPFLDIIAAVERGDAPPPSEAFPNDEPKPDETPVLSGGGQPST